MNKYPPVIVLDTINSVLAEAESSVQQIEYLVFIQADISKRLIYLSSLTELKHMTETNLSASDCLVHHKGSVIDASLVAGTDLDPGPAPRIVVDRGIPRVIRP